MVTTIKQYGLPRSGTNFLNCLIRENYNINILTNVGGWKHGHYCMPQIVKDEVHCVVSCKNIYSWIVSFYNYTKDRPGQAQYNSLSKFIRSTFYYTGQIYSFSGKYTVNIRDKNPIQYWNNMYYHWINIKLKNCQLFTIRYEDLLTNPKKVLNPISKTIGCNIIEKNIQVPQNELKPGWDGKENIASNKKFNKKEYYLKNQYIDEFSKNDLNFISQEVDHSLMKILKYKVQPS